MVNTLVFLIITAGIASAVHIMSGFKYYSLQGLPRLKALELTYKKSGLAIFLAALTTSGGMLSKNKQTIIIINETRVKRPISLKIT